MTVCPPKNSALQNVLFASAVEEDNGSRGPLSPSVCNARSVLIVVFQVDWKTPFARRSALDTIRLALSGLP